MATLEILGEPRELNLTQSKNILVNQDYSQTINNEFNKILQDAKSCNSYEKRLEMLNEPESFNVQSSQNTQNFRPDQVQEYKTSSQEYSRPYEQNNTVSENNKHSSSENNISATNQTQEKVKSEIKDKTKEQVKVKDHPEKNASNKEEKSNNAANTGNINARDQIAAMLNANIPVQQRVNDFSQSRSENRSETGQLNYLHNNNIRREMNSGINQNARVQANNANGLNNSNGLNNAITRLNNNLMARQEALANTTPNQPVRVKDNHQNLRQDSLHAAAKAPNDVKQAENHNNRGNAVNQTMPENLQKLLRDENVTVTVNSQDENRPSVQDKAHNGRNKSLVERSGAKLDLNDNAKAMTTKLNLQQDSAEANLKEQNNQESGEQIALRSGNQLYNGQVELSSFKTASFDKVLEVNHAKQVMNAPVMDQITQKTSELSQNAPSNITIALNPENLGRVEINLVSQNGTLTAQITTENSQVKDELTKGLDDLKQNLINQGVSVDKLVVNVQEPSTSNNNYSNLHQDQAFSQFDQSKYDSSNNNPDSSRQTSYQEGYNNIANSNSGGIEEEITQNAVSNDDNYISSGRTMTGRVDYII